MKVLEPQERRLLLGSLRPPKGYTLDCAIGTTFSLDLLALLFVPLAFTMFDWESEDGYPTSESLALLEALRRHAGRISIFCQAGQISIPKRHHTLFGYLEDSVFEVTPPDQRGVFHPKVWILRFQAPDEPIMYRLLVLTRNLTFDRSWDVMLVLDGELVDRRNAFALNHPLGDFVKALPHMAVRPVTSQAQSHVTKVQSEIRRVRWELPEGFDEVAFWPLGIGTSRRWPFGGRIDRMLIISPFLSEGCLSRLTAQGHGNIVVSRAESLDSLGREAYERLDAAYVLSDAADPEPSDEVDGTDDHQDSEFSYAGAAASPSLVGLHAKVYVADAGRRARIWTGSANATDAAYACNVEFLVELGGTRGRCGVDAILSRTDGAVSFADLLQEYRPPAEVPAVDLEQERLEARVEEARQMVARAGLIAKVVRQEGQEHYQLSLCLAAGARFDLPPDIQARCWPITLRELAALELNGHRQGHAPDDGALATFGPLSIEALTPFFAFELRTSSGGRNASCRFVIKLPLEGAPEHRLERVLRSLLSDRDKVLRYLLLLLLEGDSDIANEVLLSSLGPAPKAAGNGPSFSGIPLFEAMVRALHSGSQRLDEVARLVDDLKKTPEGQELLPEGFDTIWEPICAARRRLGV